MSAFTDLRTNPLPAGPLHRRSSTLSSTLSSMPDPELSSIHAAAQPLPGVHFQPVDPAGPRSIHCRTPCFPEHEPDCWAVPDWEPEDPYGDDDIFSLSHTPSWVCVPREKKRARSETPLMHDGVLSADHCLEKRMRKAYQDGLVVDCTSASPFSI